MKKKIFAGIAVLAFAVIVGLSMSLNLGRETRIADLSLINVEALATGESASSSDKLYCCSPYDKTCVTYGDNTTVMGTLRKNSPCPLF